MRPKEGTFTFQPQSTVVLDLHAVDEVCEQRKELRKLHDEMSRLKGHQKRLPNQALRASNQPFSRWWRRDGSAGATRQRRDDSKEAGPDVVLGGVTVV